MMRWMIMACGMLAAVPAAAQVTFDAPFTDHAVLQRDRAIAVHGQAAPKAQIVLSFATVFGRLGGPQGISVPIPLAPVSES